MRAITDLIDYKRVLPYDSEIFGVYQPLLGWRSKRTLDRIQAGFRHDLLGARNAVGRRLAADLELKVSSDRMIEAAQVKPAAFDAKQAKSGSTFIFDRIKSQLPPLADYKPEIWEALLNPAEVERFLNAEAVPKALKWQREAIGAHVRMTPAEIAAEANAMLAEQLQRESLAAGYFLELKRLGQTDALKKIFYLEDLQLQNLLTLLKFKSPLDYFDPFKDIDRVSLSPLGVVHLYRQYFFEFDTFLGSPVGHVWLSPGSTVELVEVTTRRTMVEKVMENETETTLKTEKSITDEDELSSAVKEDNKSDTKFGMNATVNQGWIGGSASASSTIDMATTQSKAREESHRHMRQQSEKLSTEIRKNVKSTFRTVTETTDTSSKRYVLTNTTPELLNYELRRKMRQVGVQVQDIGTYICWQTYVDDPGRQLGVSKLVHIAKDPERGQIPQPESTPAPQPAAKQEFIDIPFIQLSESRGDLDEGYKYGVEADSDTTDGDAETIKHKFRGYEVYAPIAGYVLQDATWDYQGNDVLLQLVTNDESASTPGVFRFGFDIKYVNFRGTSPIRVALNLTWKPTDQMLTAVETANKAKVDAYNEASQREFDKAFVQAAADRITAASKIDARPHDDLREEERIVVYRKLVQDMLTKGIPVPDDRTRHVLSELLNTIFDIDKMLYFVAPEWWRPRLHRSHQALGDKEDAPKLPGGSAGGTSKSLVKETVYAAIAAKSMGAFSQPLALGLEHNEVPSTNTVSWGGVGEGRSDNYYITPNSDPAKLGASLGWLMQLDGDRMRNAFLNAPWVKAVIPVRPGQERAAINWLSRLGVEGSEGLDDQYVAPAQQLAEIPHDGANPTIRDAINHLCNVVAAKHKQSMVVEKYPPEEINDDNSVRATPLDKVYEHGFYPLEGGFRLTPETPFEVFDQWIEILPTDQVVPVSVKYDPKTGRQI